MEKLYTVHELMEILQLKETTVRRLMKEMGQVNIGTGHDRGQYRVPETNLERWLILRRVTPEALKETTRRRRVPAMPMEGLCDEYGRALIKRNGKLVPRAKPPQKKQPRRAANVQAGM